MKTKPPSKISFVEAEYAKKKKSTRRELFLAKMEQVALSSRLMELREQHYPKGGKRGHPPIDLKHI